MDINTFLKKQINDSIPSRFKNVAELAEASGVSQPNLSEFLRGNRKSMNLETAWKIMRALGITFVSEHNSVIKKMGSNSVPVTVDANSAISMDVFAIAGAGPAWSMEEAEPILTIMIPPHFKVVNGYGLKIDGDSMYPTLRNGSIVGVTREFQFRQDEIFVAHLPYEGLVVKRVGIDYATNEYILKSDNIDKDKYSDIRISIDEAPDLIVGRVVWTWQSL